MLEEDSPNIKLDIPSQNVHEFDSYPSFEESVPLEQNQMLRIPHINVALAPDSDAELDIYGVQIYEEPIDIADDMDSMQPDYDDNSLKNTSFQKHDILYVEMSSQTTDLEDNTDHVRLHKKLRNISHLNQNQFTSNFIHNGIFS